MLSATECENRSARGIYVRPPARPGSPHPAAFPALACRARRAGSTGRGCSGFLVGYNSRPAIGSQFWKCILLVRLVLKSCINIG